MGSVYVQAVTSVVRRYMFTDHTSWSYPKPTIENGMGAWVELPVSKNTGQHICFERCSVNHPEGEVHIMERCDRVRSMAEAGGSKIGADRVTQMFNMIPQELKTDEQIKKPILFTKTICQELPDAVADAGTSYPMFSDRIDCVLSEKMSTGRSEKDVVVVLEKLWHEFKENDNGRLFI
jgi:hypothetical protein